VSSQDMVMKNVVLFACALGFGFLPVIAGLPFENLFTLIAIPILLGMIYFVFHQHDWPPRLVPWLFACVAVGRIGADWWMNSRHGRQGRLFDQDVWVFGGLAAVSFAYKLWRWIKDHSETPTSVNPKSP